MTISQQDREEWRRWITNVLTEAELRPGWKEALDFDGAKDWCEAMTRLLDALEETEGKLREVENGTAIARAEATAAAMQADHDLHYSVELEAKLKECIERGPATWTGYEELEGKLRVAVEALEGIMTYVPQDPAKAANEAIRSATEALQQIKGES